MLSTLEGPAYIERVAVDSVAHIKKAKEAIKKSFQTQLDGKGFSLVEVVSTCPTNWGMSPLEAMDWLRDNTVSYTHLSPPEYSSKFVSKGNSRDGHH